MPLTALEAMELQNWTAAYERLATLEDVAGEYEYDETGNVPPELCETPASDYWHGDPFAGIPNAYDQDNARF